MVKSPLADNPIYNFKTRALYRQLWSLKIVIIGFTLVGLPQKKFVSNFITIKKVENFKIVAIYRHLWLF